MTQREEVPSLSMDRIKVERLSALSRSLQNSRAGVRITTDSVSVDSVRREISARGGKHVLHHR